MRYIQRIDNAHHTWKVCLKRKNKEIHKYFTDAAHGGTAQALVAATAWRDEMQAKHATASYALWLRQKPRPTNTTGVIGVYRGTATRRVGNRAWKYEYWQGYWKGVDGKRISKAFGINKYGDEAAKELAIRARRDGLALLARELRRIPKKPLKPSKTSQFHPSNAPSVQ